MPQVLKKLFFELSQLTCIPAVRICVFLCLYAINHLNAQINDSLPVLSDANENLLKTSSSRQINNFLYNGSLRYGLTDNNFKIYLANDFSSSVLRSTVITTSESFTGKLRTEYVLLPALSFGGELLRSKHTDSRVSDLNAVSQAGISSYLTLYLAQNIRCNVGLGYLQNSQSQKKDEGLSWDMGIQVPPMTVLESQIQSYLTIHEEKTDPRINYSKIFATRVENVFSDSLTNVFEIQYRNQRNDFYLQPDRYVTSEFGTTYNIQKRTEETYSISESVSHIPLISDIAAFSLRSGLSQKNIFREFQFTPADITSTSALPASITENRFELQGALQIAVNDFFSGLQFQFQEKHEKYGISRRSNFTESLYQDRLSSELMKNNNAKRYFLALSSMYNLSTRDNVLLTVSHTKLVYDTPSDDNFDDRDELLSICRLEYNREISDFFRTNIRLEGSLNKFSYVFKERSANNYMNRIIKLVLGSMYAGKTFISMNHFEVSGNYMIYDYEKFSESIQSFSFRQIRYSDSSALAVNSSLKLRFKGTYKHSEQGNLHWSEFTLQPIRNTEEISLHPELAALLYEFTFSVGYRFFIVNTFAYKDAKRYLDNVFYSSGPTVTIQSLLQSGLSLTFSGWIDNVKNNNETFFRQPNFQFNLTYKL